MARQDFVGEIYNALVRPETIRAAGFAPTNSTWFSILRAAIQHTSLETVTKGQWIDGLAAAMHSSGIEWIPGRHRQKLTHRRLLRLVGLVSGPEVLAAPPGSLKRAALEAAAQQQVSDGSRKKLRRRRIDFGCKVPFENVPQLIQDGFAKLERLYSKAKADYKVLEHYQQARNCLQRILGDPLCDLMLIMVLTLGASSMTPQVALKERVFSGAPKRKDQALLAANMVTRMLWFLKPGDFPWGKQDDGTILRISEMTKKIGTYAPMKIISLEADAEYHTD